MIADQTTEEEQQRASALKGRGCFFFFCLPHCASCDLARHLLATMAAAHGFRGVSQMKNGLWMARTQTSINGKRKNIRNARNHATAEEAAHHYDM